MHVCFCLFGWLVGWLVDFLDNRMPNVSVKILFRLILLDQFTLYFQGNHVLLLMHRQTFTGIKVLT